MVNNYLVDDGDCVVHVEGFAVEPQVTDLQQQMYQILGEQQ